MYDAMYDMMYDKHHIIHSLLHITCNCDESYGSHVLQLLGSSHNLTFLNEFTRSNGTPYHLYANVIDSCIEIIVCCPVIREHHLIQKIPQYFDETTSS